jgi:hypothetical protein
MVVILLVFLQPAGHGEVHKRIKPGSEAYGALNYLSGDK